MGTTAEKLTHLSQTKSDIRDAIEAKGISVPTETTFRDYATKVSDIKTDFSDTFNYAERVSQDGGSVENLAEVSNLDFNDGAKLNFIPSGKKAGKSYSQVPVDGSGDWTVDRNCEATYIDKDGVLQTAQANEPRFDWSSGKPALLVEPQRTNYHTNSNNFSTNYWSKGNITLESGYLAPDGTSTATKITGNLGSSYIAASGHMNRVNSVFIKTVSGTGQAHILDRYAYTDGTPKPETLHTITEEWQRFDLIVDVSSYLIDFRGDTNLTEVIIWGAQVEEGFTATSYIKTEGTTVTRLADIIETTPPAGTTQIIETIDGVEQTPITTIPSTYQVPEGNINQIKML
jgi:hypothetical protein